MKNTRHSIFWAASLMLLTVLACVVPGQSVAPTPAPTTDTSSILSTIVAETVSAAIVLTEQAVPTATIIPESINTPTPESLPTDETASVGSTLTTQEDGTTLFLDERAGYEITIPAGWLVVRIGQPEYQDALTIAPDIQKALAGIQNNDPNTFRLYGLDTQDGHFVDQFFTNINILWNEQGTALLRDDNGLQSGVTQLSAGAFEPEAPSTTLGSTASGIPTALIESKSTLLNTSGAQVVVFQKQIVMNTRLGTIAITVSAAEKLKDDVFSAFDAMLETIKISAQ